MKQVWLIILIFWTGYGFSQTKSDLSFIEHLINKGNYKEAIFLFKSDSMKLMHSQADSLNYYKGWAHYSVKNLELSTQSFLLVGKESPFYAKSHFFAGYNQIYLNRYDEARNTFERLNIEDETKKLLVNFELGGIEMLQTNWDAAQKHFEKISPDNALLSQHITALQQLNDGLKAHHKKSAFLAGLMSGIVPGSGKIYAGKTGEGVAQMIATTGFGLVAWENYRKVGINNLRTIFFGSIFLATYISNIYGSAISVKITENNYSNAVHNQILFHLHIPLRNFFE